MQSQITIIVLIVIVVVVVVVLVVYVVVVVVVAIVLISAQESCVVLVIVVIAPDVRAQHIWHIELPQNRIEIEIESRQTQKTKRTKIARNYDCCVSTKVTKSKTRKE